MLVVVVISFKAFQEMALHIFTQKLVENTFIQVAALEFTSVLQVNWLLSSISSKALVIIFDYLEAFAITQPITPVFIFLFVIVFATVHVFIVRLLFFVAQLVFRVSIAAADHFSFFQG